MHLQRSAPIFTLDYHILDSRAICSPVRLFDLCCYNFERIIIENSKNMKFGDDFMDCHNINFVTRSPRFSVIMNEKGL